MKNLLFTIFIFSISFAQRTEKVGDFNKVTAFDQIDVTLVKSNENKVTLTGVNSEEVELVNKNGELKIRLPLTKMLSGDAISATVYFTNIDAVEANEGSRVASNEAINTISFDVITKEGSEVVLSDLQTEKLMVRTSAGSIVTIKGTVTNQDILANSGARYDGQDCVSKQTTVTVNAGGIADVYATDFVEAKTRAGGEITIYGKPKQINQKTIAGGTIKQAK
jgi:hypothetical protein